MTAALARWLALPARADRTGTTVACVAALLGGLMWVLAAPPIGLWPVAWLAGLPTVWIIDRAPTRRRAGLYGALTAVGFTAGGFAWIVHLLEVNAGLPTPVAMLGLLVLSSIHGLAYLLGARLIRALRDRRREHPRGPWPMALCAPLGFVAVELLVWTPFPFSLAITQASVGPVRGLTAALGPAGITALLLAVAGAAYDLLAGRRRWWPVVAGVVGLAGALAVAGVRPRDAGPTATVRIGIVQPNQPTIRGRNWREEIARLQAATDELARRGADLVVWSEASLPYPVDRARTEDGAQGTAERIRGTAAVPVMIGALTIDDDDRVWNSAILIAADGRFVGRADKIHRMIGSEYNPIVEWFPAARRWMPSGAGSFARGPDPIALTLELGGRAVRLAVMVCLEDAVPRFGRELTALAPDLVINLTNDTWFDTEAEPYQHEALARLRAVELGVPLIRAVNTGPSSVIDRDGEFLARTAVRAGDGRHRPDTLLVEVPIAPRARSFYAGWGAPLSWLIALAAVAWWLGPGVVARLRRRRSGSPAAGAVARRPGP